MSRTSNRKSQKLFPFVKLIENHKDILIHLNFISGWPGEAKKCDISSREITAMEIDDIPLPETDVKFQEEDMVIDLMVNFVTNESHYCSMFYVFTLHDHSKARIQTRQIYIYRDITI